jgi:hypothetical protein
MKKKLPILIGGMLVVVCIGFAVAMVMGRSGITRLNFEQIQDGMTEEEVEEIFGGKGETRDPPMISSRLPTEKGSMRIWTNSQLVVVVDFKHGAVDYKACYRNTESTFDRMRRWVGLR